MRQTAEQRNSICIPFQEEIRSRLRHWAGAHPYAVFLDSCHTEIDRYGQYDFLIGVGTDAGSCIQNWNALENHPGKWKFGILSYELKNKFESRLVSENNVSVATPEVNLFVPEIVIYKKRNSEEWHIESKVPEEVLQQIQSFEPKGKSAQSKIEFKSNFSREEYISTIEKLRGHIREGDCYEINLCQEYTANAIIQSPVSLFEKLISISPVPFAGFARFNNTWLLCASPERFLKLSKEELITQPIKGTIKRGAGIDEDEKLQKQLQNSVKDRAENVMIVDLSRNDLHRSCETNTVRVPELFEVQNFPQVHHLVSTVVGKMRTDVSEFEAIENAFPPGSMTGAPKVRVMELIDEYERSARGIYAGSLGYFSPEGDFDFNVVIRSLVYDADSHTLSYHVGGAITWDSDPESEYAETLLKAKAITTLFNNTL